MTAPEELGILKTLEWGRLQDLLDRFETARRQSDAVDLGQFLPPPDDPLRATALHELIKIELDILWQCGSGPDLEAYLERFPELGSAATLSARLIYEEFRVRQLHGDKLALDAYQARFPAQFAELRQLVQDQPVPSLPQPVLSSLTPATVPVLGATVAGRTDHHYKLLEPIGSGGFSDVWRAEALGGPKVAMKISHRPIEDAEARREKESLELIIPLAHVYLLQTHTWWVREDDRRLVIVTELAECDLRQHLKACREAGLPAIPVDELLRYFAEAAEALDYLHSQGILHRDVKPSNILLLNGHAKVADFGLARACQAEWLTVSGSGTIPYMAPEVLRNKASTRSDQFSLALAYAELRLNRCLLLDPEVMISALVERRELTLELAPMPAAEQQALRRALLIDPEQRYPNCSAFARALQEATVKAEPPRDPPVAKRDADPWDDSSTDVLEDSRPAHPPVRGWNPPPPNRRPLWAALAVAAVLAGLGSATWYFWPTRPPTPPSTTGLEDEAAVPTGRAGPFRPVPGAAHIVSDPTGGKRYYDQIECVLDGQPPVRFRLIPHERAADPPTYYIMENKVWNGLFAEFAAANRGVLVNPQWRGGAAADGRLPALGVTVAEAHGCAAWLGGLLPTTQQWDRAAGRGADNRGQGPFQGSWDDNTPLDIAVNRKKAGPMPVGTARADVSPFAIHDLAGNGREWTRNVAGPGDRTVPLAEPRPDDLVILRGRSYTWSRPLLYADLEREDDPENCQTQYYQKASPYTGFRCVIEP